jgi:hypothetical protein
VVSGRARGGALALPTMETLAMLAIVALAGCKLDEAAVPSAKPQIVLHAILNPIVVDQVVLVEQTLTGEVEVPDRVPSDSLDPILSGGGIPITDAVVTMRRVDAPGGGAAVAIQDAADRPDGKGKGVYRFRNAPPPLLGPPHGEIAIVRGARYELVVTWRGQEARAFTTVPNPDRLLPQAEATRTFNVDHDSLVFDWPRATAAKRYGIIASSPYGGMLVFSDSARLVVRGRVRNLFAEGMPYVFTPGFRQTISASAVDTNYFDYFRSVNNPFTGTGIINHVDGGIGLFGATYPLDTLAVDVIADFDEPIEGRYVGGASGSDVLELYLGESLGDGARVVSGRLTQGIQKHGVIGTTSGGGKLSLAVLRGWFAKDALYPLTATAAGDSVTALDPTSGERVAWRRAAPALALAQAGAHAW